MNSLEKNTFYNSLLTTYRKRYNESTNKCHTICLPINDSFDCNIINEKFISGHILKASPLLKGHFVAANNKHNFDVEIDGQLLRVTRGFGDKNLESIKILSEELAYNYQNKEYRILVIENPLINSSNRKLNYDLKNKNNISNKSFISFNDCETFLNTISPNLTEKLRSKVQKLVNTYIVLPNYIDDASERIKVVIDWAIECFRGLSSLPEITNNELCLESAIESYAIGLMDPKLMVAINKCFEREDKILYNKFIDLFQHNINPLQFGAQKAFENFTINSIIVNELSQIEKKMTPLEKLYCLRKTLDLVSEQMTKSVEDKYYPLGAKTESICIMSDDLIATVICVLTSVKPKRFESEINFIHKFSWNLPQNNEFGYSLVTFEVVKEFIKNYNFDQNSCEKCPKSETKEPKSAEICDTNVKHIYDMSSPLDRELEKISKMIDNSSINSNQSKNNSKEVNEDLGEFLGALSQNSFAVGIGKQF